MHSILKIPPHSSTTFAYTIFSDCCIGFTYRARAFIFASVKSKLSYKANSFKNGVPKNSHRSRLHYSECTNLEKNNTSSVEFGSESYGKGRPENGLDNLEKMDGRNQLSTDSSNFTDFVSTNGDVYGFDKNLEELSGRSYLDNNGAGSPDIASISSVNGSERLEKIEEGVHLGEGSSEENGKNLVGRGFKTSLESGFALGNDRNAISGSGSDGNVIVGNGSDGNVIYGNGSDKGGELDRKDQLGRSDFEENSGNCDSVVGIDGGATFTKRSETTVETDRKGGGYALKEGIGNIFETNANKEQLNDAVIRKVLSPYSFDPLEVKTEKGLLSEEELEKLKILENFVYEHRFDHGHLVVKVMDAEHAGNTLELLTDSFAELMWGPLTYRPLLRFTVRENMLDRRRFIPHAATLVGLYAEGEGEWILGGTLDLSFDSKGAPELPVTPIPPKSSPYLCNMTVSKTIRRRGIGWHLLKASEKLVSQMGSSEIYLHCRIIDMAPFNMYTKAGYNVVQTDSILTLLTLQRRRYLMYKKLPVPS